VEQVKIARIAVSAANYLIDKPYDYVLPEQLSALEKGMRVLVPFGRGNRICEGIILSVGEGERKNGLKSVLSSLDERPVLDAAGIRLALWMRDRYFCTMYEAVRTILPAGLWFRTQSFYAVCEMDKAEVYAAAKDIPGAGALLDILYLNGRRAEEETLREGVPKAGEILKALCDRGLLHREAESKRHVKDGRQKMVALAVPAEEAMAAVEGKQRSAPLRYEVIKLLSAVGVATRAEVCYFTGASASTITSLKKAGLVELFEEEKLRITRRAAPEPGEEIVLNEEQQAAFDQIAALTRQNAPSVTLLHGVTGSGKTQVYIRLVQEVLSQGKTAIVLVPEIALTPQMMDKFTAYFDTRVAMLHSGLRMTELYDQWKRIRRGQVQVVLGTRSAIFAPLQNIGLIILDEEQENSYQSETAPRYHAREVAQYRCGTHGAALVLGSATPSVVTRYAAKTGTYHYAALRRRYNRHPLPEVLFADMKEEAHRGSNGVIGSLLCEELAQNLERGEQSILLLNRRGSHHMLLCGECAHVIGCPRCSVPLTYHSANGRLMCHYCGYSRPAPDACPACGGRMKYVGAGTQRAEEELHELFPNTEILRMDADTASARGGHEKILARFEHSAVPILLGTQMVAKGLDFANVTLVGVLAADLSLYVDHYCAAERTFDLLTQVIGRAGRGDKGGRAVIQTYSPENEVLQCAAAQDYERFYRGELRMRKLHSYPPFSDLFTLVVTGMEESRVLRASAALRDAMRQALSKDERFGGEAMQVVGPAPARIAKINDRYRCHVYLVARNDKTVRNFIAYYIKAFGRNKENRGLSIFVNCNATDA
jgi:primosomal protein N' (replication factor Y)